MFNPVYICDRSCRLHLLARDCGGVRTAAELRRTVDENRARANNAESLSAGICTVAECSRRTDRPLD
jgi:hypothetical protein